METKTTLQDQISLSIFKMFDIFEKNIREYHKIVDKATIIGENLQIIKDPKYNNTREYVEYCSSHNKTIMLYRDIFIIPLKGNVKILYNLTENEKYTFSNELNFDWRFFDDNYFYMRNLEKKIESKNQYNKDFVEAVKLYVNEHKEDLLKELNK